MHVRAGRAIRVIVSKGGQVVFVPDIFGKPLAEAQSILASNGMQMGAVSEMYSIEAAKGAVLSQTPSSGTVVTRGALIDVSVSKGLPPAGLPLLPDFAGKSVDDVKTWAAGVSASVKVKEDPKAVGPLGSVAKQDPIAGQPLLEGEEVQVTIVPLVAAGQGARFTYKVPDGAGDVTIRIMARDNRGESSVYEGKHKGGAVVEIPIGVNTTTRFRVYMNDVLQEERVVEP
jgi:serine/threonine-protein kinase